jgi:hypothetical protein
MLGIILFTVLILALVLGGVPVVQSALAGRKGPVKRELAAERNRSEVAQKALRQIVAGDSYPVLTAGDALDKINNTYDKELTQ